MRSEEKIAAKMSEIRDVLWASWAEIREIYFARLYRNDRALFICAALIVRSEEQIRAAGLEYVGDYDSE